MAIELRDRPGLAEMLDAERAHAVAAHGAEPGERRRMAVEHGDDAAMGRHLGEQPLDMAARVHQAALARAARRRPAGIEPVGGGHGEKADIAPVLRHQAHRLDRLRRDRACIRHHHLAIRPRLAQPIGAVDDGVAQLRCHRSFDLLDRPRREP